LNEVVESRKPETELSKKKIHVEPAKKQARKREILIEAHKRGKSHREEKNRAAGEKGETWNLSME